jgi:hypothetical protein
MTRPTTRKSIWPARLLKILPRLTPAQKRRIDRQSGPEKTRPDRRPVILSSIPARMRFWPSEAKTMAQAPTFRMARPVPMTP